jgi:hypothetical protein
MMEQWVMDKWANALFQEFSLTAKRKNELYPSNPINISG